MKRMLLAVALLTTAAALGAAYTYAGRQEQPRSYVLRQNIVEKGEVVGTVTSYFSRNGDWRTVRSCKDGRGSDHGFIAGRGGYTYNPKDDSLYRLPHIPANLPPFSWSAEELKKIAQFAGKAEVGGMEAYMLRNLINDNPDQLAADVYHVAGIKHPVRVVAYGPDGKTVESADEFVSLEFREPTTDELMQRHDGKPVKEAPDPRRRGGGE